MKKLIINADDFGLSRGINKAIIGLFTNGALTSTSLLVNMPGFDEAAALSRMNPCLGIGLHINVVRGRPVSSPEKVRSLCRNGFFRGRISSLMALPYRYKEVVDEFTGECRAQIEKALAHGIDITHLDSEKHIHMVQPFFEALLKVSREYGILRIRSINEGPFHGWPLDAYSLFNRRLYMALCLSFSSMERKRLMDQYQFASPDHFYGLSADGTTAGEDYARILFNLKEGTTEIMCHPGHMDEEWQSYPLNREKYYINDQRQKEFDLLSSPTVKELIKKYGISLVTYKGL